MERSAHYEEFLTKAKELFFPNLSGQLGKFKAMEVYMANYNGNQVDIGFSIEGYKKTTGMNLPRLYLMAKIKRSKCPIFYDVKRFSLMVTAYRIKLLRKIYLLLLAKANCNDYFIFINQPISIIPQKIFVLGYNTSQNNK